MEENTVKQEVYFGIYLYRKLLESKLNKINQLDKLFEEQNSHVLQKLREEGVIYEKGMPKGFIMNPQTEEELNNVKNSISLYATKYKEYGGASDVSINIKEHLSELMITEEEVLKCVIN